MGDVRPPIAPPSPSVDAAVRRMPCVVGIAIFTSAMISSISPQATAMIAPSTTILFVTPLSKDDFRPRHALKWDPPAASLFYGPAQLSEKVVTPLSEVSRDSCVQLYSWREIACLP